MLSDIVHLMNMSMMEFLIHKFMMFFEKLSKPRVR